MNHWLSFRDHTPAELAGLIALARRIKAGDAPETAAIRNRVLVMLFFNSSLRTRTSFEAAMLRFGGHAICLNVGGDTWNLEYADGAVMNGDKAEHIREAAPVLGRYGEALAVRTFAALKNADDDLADRVIRSFAEHARVPVLNMESAAEHPCQGLADWMTMQEKLGDPRGRRFVLSWAPHIKPLPMAVPHSAVLAAAAAGMQVTIAHPAGYELQPQILATARQWCAAAGTKLEVTDRQLDATQAADIVYVKSWGAAGMYSDAAAQKASFAANSGWMVTREHLGRESRLMHCLPVRRNVVIADSGLDDPRCIVVDQAENRLWTQAAVLARVLGQVKR
jgi:N-acetylornithine carbamoyltransferase